MSESVAIPPPPSPPVDPRNAGQNPDEDEDQPNFEPIFTLLTNSTTNATAHPRVHYLFSDDDTTALTEAQSNPDSRPIIVDLVRTESKSWAVSWASSLNPDFALTDSNITVQQGEGDGEGSLMLQLEGTEIEPLEGGADSLPSSASAAIAGRDDVDGLVKDFKRRMVILNKVVAEGDKRRAAVPQGQSDDEEQTGEESLGSGMQADVEEKDV